MTVSRLNPSPIELSIMDFGPLYDQNLEAPGVYVAAAPYDGAALFRGALINMSVDGGVTYKAVGRVVTQAVLGQLTADLEPAAYPSVPDFANTVSIFVKAGAAFSKASFEDLFTGEALLHVNGEILAYQNAANPDTEFYDLTRLVRGIYGTEQNMVTHAADSQITMFDPDTLTFIEIPGSLIGHTLSFKATAPGVTLEDAPEVQHVFAAENMRPLIPIGFESQRDGSDNLLFTWERRTRHELKAISGQEAPLGEKERKYEIEVYTTGSVLLRTLVAAEETVTYGRAMQIEDGATPGDSFKVRVHQVGSWLRSGYTEVTV